MRINKTARDDRVARAEHAVALHARVTPERDGTADARSVRQHAVARRPSSVARHPSRAKSGMIGA
ncbi:putative hydantoin racemase [Burkholderia pseudomallei 668]|nr:putative hydantoin racemase [Burkholderia pseudomallei 668]